MCSFLASAKAVLIKKIFRNYITGTGREITYAYLCGYDTYVLKPYAPYAPFTHYQYPSNDKYFLFNWYPLSLNPSLSPRTSFL